MEDNVIRIDVKEDLALEDLGLGGPTHKDTPFEAFLKENGYVNDGGFMISLRKESEEAYLWKRVATYHGELPDLNKK